LDVSRGKEISINNVFMKKRRKRRNESDEYND
jgi:hypothetical protein